MKKLHISDDLALPLQVVTEKLGWLGVTGSGKTYGASKLAELMWDAGAQFIVLDVVGVWYGLRLAQDGKTPSDITIPIFGGLHGDVPLEPTAGALMADLIVDRGISAILDVSQFEYDTDKARFGHDFAARFFFRKKAAPSAVHLFLEECQEFVPQNPQKGEERMLHAFTRLQKLGRNFGIGSSYISQRPQDVSKKALNMAQTLFVFRTTGSQERAAIEKWIEDKALDQDIANDLPKIPTGQCHAWSPELLKISETVRISEKRTFNASSTPEVGARAVARHLAPIDLEKIASDMAATIEKAKEADPEEWKKKYNAEKRRVAELERQASKPSVVTKEKTADPAKLRETAQKMADRAVAKLVRGLTPAIENANKRVHGIGDAVEIAETALDELRARVEEVEKAAASVEAAPTKVDVKWTPAVPRSDSKAVSYSRPAEQSNGELTGPEHRILDAIAWMESIGIIEPEQTAVAFLAGYTIGGGAWNNPRGALRTKGMLDYRGDRLVLTALGRQHARWPDAPLTVDELQRRVMDRLPGPERKILSVLLEHYPQSVDSDELARAAGYEPGGGAFNNPRGRLRSLGLAEYPERGRVAASPVLFLEGR